MHMYIGPNADIPIIVVLNLLDLYFSYLSNLLFLFRSYTLYRRILLRTILVLTPFYPLPYSILENQPLAPVIYRTLLSLLLKVLIFLIPLR